MQKKLIVKQEGYKECGVACLLSIIRYYDGNIPINTLIELTHTNKNGTSFYNLKKTAAKFGIETEAFKIEQNKEEALRRINKPTICQIIDNNYEHFVVVYRTDSKKITIMDPARGERKIKIEIFKKIWTGYIMTFIKTKPIPKINEEKYLNKIILLTLKKNKVIVLNIVVLSIIFTILSTACATYSGFIIDHILNTNKQNLINITIIFLFVLIFKELTSFFRNKVLIHFNQKFDCTIFLTAFQKILLLPYSYYKNRTTGEIITRINDLEYVKNLMSKIILTVFLDLIISTISAIILFKINSKMFFILVITIIIYILIIVLFRPILKRYTNINQENNAKINSLMIETINGFETIKNSNLESTMNKKMTTLYTKSLKDIKKYDSINNLEILIKGLIANISLIMVELIGFNNVFENKLTTGQIIIFINLVTYFMTPITNIIDLNKEYYYAINTLKRANNLLNIKSINLLKNSNFSLKGNINIKKLSFSYNDYTNVLTSINLKIKAKEKILILGDSGSGKSTILKILAKKYQVKRDKIYIDDIDINDISISNIRKYFTIVSQNEILFTDTIKNNIKLNREIDEIEFNKICKLLYIDKFINNLFLGYNTKLEENGNNLSGGQKQRIILARSLLKSGNIILIDEGLNAIDINLERKILKNIFNEYKNKTIIIVSHRIENIDLYDRVIEIKEGCIKQNIQKPKKI